MEKLKRQFRELSVIASLKDVNLLLNVAAHSVKIKELSIEEPGGKCYLRPTLHIFLSAPFGHGKSTLLKQLMSNYPSVLLTHVTVPGLIGSIDRSSKMIISAAAWEARNKLLILDEYTSTRPSQVGDILLQLLEDQRYSRKIASYSADHEEVDGDLYFRVKNGLIDLKTRFSCVIATMKNPKKAREYSYKALLSRTIPLRYILRKEDLDSVLDGKQLFEKINFQVSDEVMIKLDDFMHIREIMDEAYEDMRRKGITKLNEVYLRTIGDCCRVFAVLGHHDDKLYKKIFELKVSVL